VISIGAVYQGPELKGSRINLSIMAASKVLKELRGSLIDHGRPWVNAVFVVPGSLGAVDFDGLEYGDYSKKDHAVVVKVAVPASVVQSDEIVDFIFESLHGSNAMAFEFFRLKGENFPLREAEDLVLQIVDRLKGFPSPPGAA
jgi:hypothetical protein